MIGLPAGWRRAAGAALAALVAASCGGGPEAAPPKVFATLQEFTVSLRPATSPPGEVTFEVTNSGAQEHQFLLIRTDSPPDQLTEEEGRVVEDEYEIVGHVHGLGVAEERSVTVDLSPGAYVAICNIPGHYRAGMRAAFSVE